MIRIIDLAPVACPRPRVTRRGVFYPNKYIEWTKTAERMLRDLRLSMMTGAIELDITFVIKRPKSLMRRADPDERIAHTKRPDLDNYLKSFLDAAQKAGLFNDDSQIYRVDASKKYSAKSENPKINFELKEGRC